MGNLEQEVTLIERGALLDDNIVKAIELGRFKIGIRQARDSSQVYDYTPEKSDQKDVFGATYFDASTGKVFISDCTCDGEFSIDRFGHEAMHVVQFEQGKISFGAKENRAMRNLSNQYPDMSHGLYDIIDEYEAYRIQSLLETPKRQFEKAFMPYDIEHDSHYIHLPREYLDVDYLYNRSRSLPVNVIPNFKKLADDYKFAFRYKGQTFKP